MEYSFLVILTLITIGANKYLNNHGYFVLLKSPYDHIPVQVVVWLLIISTTLMSGLMLVTIISVGNSESDAHSLIDTIVIFTAFLQLLMTWGYSYGILTKVKLIAQCYPNTDRQRNIFRTIAETLADDSTQSAQSVLWFNAVMCTIVGLLN